MTSSVPSDQPCMQSLEEVLGYVPLCTPVVALISEPKLVKLLKNSLHLEGLIVEA